MSDPIRFRFWIRCGCGDDPTFSIRFDVGHGKGLLRVARPGVLVDPPARQSGTEEGLTPAQVRASLFLHIWDSGGKGQGYVLSRLSDEILLTLPVERWVDLGSEFDGGFFWLVPRTDEPDRCLDSLEAAAHGEQAGDDVTAVAVTTKIENQILLTSPQGKQDQPDVQLRAQVVRYERRRQARESVQQK